MHSPHSQPSPFGLQDRLQSTEDRLFAEASQAVVIARLPSLQVFEVNAAALHLLGVRREELIGSPVLAAFAGGQQTPLAHALARAHRSGVAAPVPLRTLDARTLHVALSITCRGEDSFLLMRLESSAANASATGREVGESVVLDSLDRLTDGFVVADAALHVSYLNHAFLELAGLSCVSQLRGKSLAAWLDLSQIDLVRMSEQYARREAVSVWNSVLRRASGATFPVKVTAVAVPDGEHAAWGFCITRLGGGAAKNA